MAALDGLEGFLLNPILLSLTVAIDDWHIPVACHNDAFLFLTPLSHIIIWFSPFVVLDVHICRDDDQNTATHSPVLMKEKNLS